MRRSKKDILLFGFFIFVLFLGIGYAFLNASLTINGTSSFKAGNWNVYFDNVQVTSGSVSLSQGDSAPVIDSDTKTTVSYTISLKEPGEFYEFTVDIVNDGSIDAMIGSISSKLNGTEISVSNPIPSYLSYEVTYIDDTPIAVYHYLKGNTTETYKIRVSYKTDIGVNDLPSTAANLSFQFGVRYIQANSNAINVPHANFSTDDWSRIIRLVQKGVTSYYNVGDTKQITLGNSLGTHTVRIANKSTPAECSTQGFSQTACGFVIEFADVITTHNMNSSNSNAGGWPASAMRTYLNDTNDSTSIINSIPEPLRSAIIDTYVVSGYGSTEANNFPSTDKLYLLASHEIWEDDDGKPNSGISISDSAYNQTRQLDYYAELNVTTTNYSKACKKGGGNYAWLRSSYKSSVNSFYLQNIVVGRSDWGNASNPYRVSPAFKIG
ncbi:MAG: hypothetical protein IKF71_05090 [Bacilli bacterium]|nr:hypothetical protein [Bacilli bacterium]